MWWISLAIHFRSGRFSVIIIRWAFSLRFLFFFWCWSMTWSTFSSFRAIWTFWSSSIISIIPSLIIPMFPRRMSIISTISWRSMRWSTIRAVTGWPSVFFIISIWSMSSWTMPWLTIISVSFISLFVSFLTVFLIFIIIMFHWIHGGFTHWCWFMNFRHWKVI